MRRQRLEGNHLAAGEQCGQEILWLGARQQQHNARGWLLQCFEQGVDGLGGHSLYVWKNEDTPRSGGGREIRQPHHELADDLHTEQAFAFLRRHQHEIGMVAVRHLAARGAHTTGSVRRYVGALTEQQFRELQRKGGFADELWTREEISVAYLARRYRPRYTRPRLLMPNHVAHAHRSSFTVGAFLWLWHGRRRPCYSLLIIAYRVLTLLRICRGRTLNARSEDWNATWRTNYKTSSRFHCFRSASCSSLAWRSRCISLSRAIAT